MRRVGIVGSRPPSGPVSFAESELFENLCADLAAFVRSLPDDAIVISGGAEGIDTAAATMARSRGLEVIEHLPDPTMPSPERYHARNQRIVDDSTELAAFVTPWARGTWDTHRRARKKGIPIQIYRRAFGGEGPVVTREEGRRT